MGHKAQLLVFRVDERLYGLGLSQVVRVIRAVDVTPLPQTPDIVLGAIDIQGEIVPVLDIRQRFGFPRREVGVDDQFIIANTSQRTVVLAVDTVKEIIERPAEEIVAAESILPNLKQIHGVLKLEAGLTLIHDLDRFLSQSEAEALDDASTMEPIHG